MDLLQTLSNERAAGVKNYVGFANQVLKLIKKKPVSFEIFADDKKNIEKQANLISTWGKNVYVKIPIINTKNKFNDDLIGRLNNKGVKVNVTAVFTVEQTKKLLKKIGKKQISYQFLLEELQIVELIL